MYNRKCLLLLFLFLMQAAFVCTASYGQSSPEKIKAVFLFKFFDYVTWSDGKDASKKTSPQICTLGSNDFGDVLQLILSKKNNYTLKKITSLDQASKCHVLYSKSLKRYDTQSIKKASGVLIVSEDSDFDDMAGIIRMYEKNGKIKLSIDLKNAERQNIKISSRLLDIADVKR